MPRSQPLPFDPGSPEDVEQQFYEALQAGDIERLMAVWSDDDDIVCVHPSGVRLVGPTSIRATFDAAFAQGGIPVRPDSVRRVHTHDSAVHSVIERLQTASPDTPQDAWVHATNVYMRTGLGWRLVAHHASPGSVENPAEPPLPAGTLLH